MHTTDSNALHDLRLEEMLDEDPAWDDQWPLGAGDDLNGNVVTLDPFSAIMSPVNDEVDVLLVSFGISPHPGP